MAYYPKAARKLLPENTTQSRINPRTVCLHTAVSNGNSLYSFWMSPGSDGVESHFYLQKSGGFEQYMDTTRRADCQRDGNSFCISVESWDGYPHGWDNGSDVPAWNTAQVDSLVDFLVWCHKTHDIPLRISRYWNDSGIAWHRKYIGSPGFASSARACPGDRRVAQIPGIIAAAKRKVQGEEWSDVATKAEIKDAVREVVREELEKSWTDPQELGEVQKELTGHTKRSRQAATLGAWAQIVGHNAENEETR